MVVRKAQDFDTGDQWSCPAFHVLFCCSEGKDHGFA